MKFFIDSAVVEEVRQALTMGVCDGVTTNPSLVAKTGKPFDQVIEEIGAIMHGPLSLEVTAMDARGMVTEARALAKRYPNVVVKIPMTRDGMQATRQCREEGIATNVTLVFSALQALLAAKAGATYVSPFVGRLDDIATDGMPMVSDIVQIYDNYGFATEVIVASVRHPIHILQAARIGAHVCTIPFPVVTKLYDHPLTDRGIEAFLKDWKKVPST